MNDIDTTAQPNEESAVPTAPETPTAGTENDNSAASPTVEETTANPNPAQEGDDPNTPADNATDSGTEDLHKNPRWQEREKDWKERFNDQEKRHQDDMQALRTEFEEKYGKPKDQPETADPNGQPETPPPWFGGDEKQWAEFKSWNKNLLTEAEERGVKRATQAMEEKTKAEQNAIKEATDFMNTEITTIEGDKTINPQAVKVDKNKLLKIVQDYKLVDTEGRWNYRAGWEIYKTQLNNAGNQKNTQDRKNIASATTSNGRAEPATPNVVTSEDFRKPGARPW